MLRILACARSFSSLTPYLYVAADERRSSHPPAFAALKKEAPLRVGPRNFGFTLLLLRLASGRKVSQFGNESHREFG